MQWIFLLQIGKYFGNWCQQIRTEEQLPKQEQMIANILAMQKREREEYENGIGVGKRHHFQSLQKMNF